MDIHRKPGYDPVELFLDPKIPAVKLKIAWRLLQKKLGLRMLMDVIPLDAALVKGSHGRRPADKKDWPVFITSQPEILGAKEIESTDIFPNFAAAFSEHLEIYFKAKRGVDKHLCLADKSHLYIVHW